MSNAEMERNEYISRINRVLDYIEQHLKDELSLATLSETANFSKFHFHRIFRAFMGETLNKFILRIRLEKAASLLLFYKDKSITEIALDCGFSGSAAFARAFKETYKISATRWRSVNSLSESKIGKTNSKIEQMISKIGKEFSISSYYIDNETYNQIWRIDMKNKIKAKIEVKELETFHMAYVRHIGTYEELGKKWNNLMGDLMKWAGPRGLINFPATKLMAVYHDDPKITDPEKLRTSVCITVPEETEVNGAIGKMSIPGGTFAVEEFEISTNEFQDAWDSICLWLPESGYQPDDKPCFEIYLNNPQDHPENKCIIHICMPVKPM